MVNPQNMVQNQPVFAPAYQQWMGPPQGPPWAPPYGYHPQQYSQFALPFALPFTPPLAPLLFDCSLVIRVDSSSPTPFDLNADDMIRTEFKSKRDEEPLLLPASKNNDEIGFNMASLHASSPLRSDIPIDAQLDAFHV